MEENVFFSPEEKEEFLTKYKILYPLASPMFEKEEWKILKDRVKEGVIDGSYQRTSEGLNLLLINLSTIIILIKEIGLKKSAVAAVIVYNLCENNIVRAKELKNVFGEEIETIVNGLLKVNSLYVKDEVIESDNFRKLLLSFAEDIRVIIIMIAERLSIMRMINHHPNDKYRQDITQECAFLYTPLAHRLGLYSIKSELEDLTLKYQHRDIYTDIAHKLNQTKVAREAYIKSFIDPVKKKLEATGLNFEIKGRTKSIYSIWNKIKKQNTDIENIYDLFAIRVILNTSEEKEKAECWQVYSIITDMFQPNPKRMKDWLSIPKSNGYESLHITVLGPLKRWVEVQIRSKRMDEIAERGLAAHWKYKGIKGESEIDQWLSNIREVLENNTSPNELMKNFKMDLYKEEIFVFTPNGDLHKLPKGATVLDFAFLIHSKLGTKCVGAIINNHNVKINYVLKSGDQIEIITSPQQAPKQDWLNIVCTSKARIKIKQTLKENEHKEAEFGKELLQRRFKNRKIEMDESVMMRLIKKMGYKTVTSFNYAIAKEQIEINNIIDLYSEIEKGDKEAADVKENRTAENYIAPSAIPDDLENKDDVLVIEQNLKGIDYKLAKCCNPIYGDDVFGFISIQGGIKIHRQDCSNASQMKTRYPYRIVKAKWSGKSGDQYTITLRVIGNDDIGIVTNITSIISKEKNLALRSISIDSVDGLFQGHLSVSVDNLAALTALIKKIQTIKGVKSVSRMS
ncbi:MAG: RelA/SpoT family protein [Bacteroidales bacterium]|nr:RelA/SpoT family protein [Bacteroidales bacterium]